MYMEQQEDEKNVCWQGQSFELEDEALLSQSFDWSSRARRQEIWTPHSLKNNSQELVGIEWKS